MRHCQDMFTYERQFSSDSRFLAFFSEAGNVPSRPVALYSDQEDRIFFNTDRKYKYSYLNTRHNVLEKLETRRLLCLRCEHVFNVTRGELSRSLCADFV